MYWRQDVFCKMFVCSEKQWHLPTPSLQKNFYTKSRDHYVYHEVSGSHHERREMIPGLAWPSITKQVVCKIKVYVLETHHGGHLLETCRSWWCPSKISPIMFFWQKYLHQEAKSQEQRWEAVEVLKLISKNTFLPEGGCKCFVMSILLEVVKDALCLLLGEQMQGACNNFEYLLPSQIYRVSNAGSWRMVMRASEIQVATLPTPQLDTPLAQQMLHQTSSDFHSPWGHWTKLIRTLSIHQQKGFVRNTYDMNTTFSCNFTFQSQPGSHHSVTQWVTNFSQTVITVIMFEFSRTLEKECVAYKISFPSGKIYHWGCSIIGGRLLPKCSPGPICHWTWWLGSKFGLHITPRSTLVFCIERCSQASLYILFGFLSLVGKATPY